MARFRYAILENDKAVTSTQTSGVETIDLPKTGILTQLDIQLAYKKVIVDDRALPDWAAVQKIEVLVDGSTVVKSLTGRQVRALCWYNGGPFTTTGWFWSTGGSQDSYTAFPLYFGRFAGDTEYGLDLGAFSNAQLKITWNTTTTSQDGNTYDANASDPTFTYNIMAKILDGTPTGFRNMYMQSRQVDEWTVAASTERNTEIPRGFELYGIMFGSRYKNVGFASLFEKIKLDFDNGKWLPLDMDYENIIMAFKDWYPEPVLVGFWENSSTGDDYDTNLMQINAMSMAATGGTGVSMSYDAHEMGLHDTAFYDFDGSADSDISMKWRFQMGWGPHQTIYIPMKHLVDGGKETVTTTQFGRIDFKVTTGSGAGSSAVSRVVAEYLKPNRSG